MIAAVFTMLAQVVTGPAVDTVPVTPGKVAPTEMPAMAELRFRRRAELPAGYTAFVRDEVRAGRCIAATRRPNGTSAVTIDMAVLVTGAGEVRRIVPRAIGCPTVEQYATGLVERMARANLDPDTGERDGWLHTAIAFEWHE